MSSFSQIQAHQDVEKGRGLSFCYSVRKPSFGSPSRRIHKISIAPSPRQQQCLQKPWESDKAAPLRCKRNDFPFRECFQHSSKGTKALGEESKDGGGTEGKIYSLRPSYISEVHLRLMRFVEQICCCRRSCRYWSGVLIVRKGSKCCQSKFLFIVEITFQIKHRQNTYLFY